MSLKINDSYLNDAYMEPLKNRRFTRWQDFLIHERCGKGLAISTMTETEKEILGGKYRHVYRKE